jgi:eukaryotic-like serine/threonine-protein kinase
LVFGFRFLVGGQFGSKTQKRKAQNPKPKAPMDQNRWKQIDELVDAALDLPENEREAFIENCANGDEDLKRAVAELVAAQSKTNEFLQHSAMKIVAKALAEDEPKVRSESLLNKKIATYRIEKLLGAGGMGEVYLAFDEKMKRNVALKILPAEYGSNDERVKRFEIEARAISSINHPNIVTIYDVGNFEGINYIATEFVEGKTLRDLIGGKFKLRNVMANSIQICDALSAAHAEGIIHRDIKPENIMIRKDGYAKILDFGVAKLTEIGPETMRGFANTTKGMIIGTPAYMSPTQVSGDNVDHRTDIWSCGVVLYEFVTGKNPFKGANRQATFQAILTADPMMSSELNPDIPEDLDRILMKVLEKDPELGYQTASDLRADLKRIKRELDSSPSGSYSGQTTRIVRAAAAGRRRLLTVAIPIALLVAAAVTWAIFFRGGAGNGMEWSVAKNVQLTFQSGTEAYPSLSPDGKSFLFAAQSDGDDDIFLQRIGGDAKNLTLDSKSGDTMPVYSPEGDRIAFRSEREPKGIYVMGATGENPKRVADIGYSPSWSPDGKELVVATNQQPVPAIKSRSSLWIVNVESSAKRLLIDGIALQPSWSPDGKRIAFWYTGDRGKRIVATISPDGGEPVVFAETSNTNWNPVWSPDGKYLYYASDRSGNMAFWRAPIDTETGNATGEHDIVPTPGKFNRHLAFSRDGKRMVYVQTSNQSNIKTAPFDANKETITGEPKWVTRGDFEFTAPELSPDGTKFVSRLIRKTQDDIVSINADGSGIRDLTNDAAFDRYPRWSADGKRIAFTSDRSGNYEIWAMDADGTNLRQITDIKTSQGSFPIWSPDGQRMSYDSGTRIFVMDANKPWSLDTSEMLPLGENGGFFRMWDWSPDGTMMAGFYEASSGSGIGYYTFETGKYERVTDFNSIPRWLPDNRRLIFERSGEAFIIEIDTKRVRRILPEIEDRIRNIDVSPDGKLLYYTTSQSESDIWLLDLRPEK